MKPAIAARDVRQGFGRGRRRMPILLGVGLEVGRGESCPSGGGKPTLPSPPGCLPRPDREADLSRRLVRSFVEGLDASRVEAGRRALVTAFGFPEKAFGGRAAPVASRMGRRVLQAADPGEESDLYFAGVLIDLEVEDAAELPPTSRVQARVSIRPEEQAR